MAFSNFHSSNKTAKGPRLYVGSDGNNAFKYSTKNQKVRLQLQELQQAGEAECAEREEMERLYTELLKQLKAAEQEKGDLQARAVRYDSIANSAVESRFVYLCKIQRDGTPGFFESPEYYYCMQCSRSRLHTTSQPFLPRTGYCKFHFF